MHGAPTYFGPSGYALISHQDSGYWELLLDAGNAPPEGYVLRGPFPAAPTRLDVDGRALAPDGKSAVSIPAGARKVLIYFK